MLPTPTLPTQPAALPAATSSCYRTSTGANWSSTLSAFPPTGRPSLRATSALFFLSPKRHPSAIEREMKARIGFLAALFLCMGVMFPASALSDGDDNPVADDYVALTNDDDMKAGLFDDVPGIAGCCGEYTSSVYPSLSSSSSSSCSAEGCGGHEDDTDGTAAVVEGTMTLLHSVCFEQPTFMHVKEVLLIESRDMLDTMNLHFIVHRGGALIIRAPAMQIARDEASLWPLFHVSGAVIFEASGSMPALLDGSLKDEGGVVLLADNAAAFLSGQDVVRYPSNNAITVSSMTEDEAGDGFVRMVSPHQEDVDLRPELKASLAGFHDNLNAKCSVPASSSSSPSLSCSSSFSSPSPSSPPSSPPSLSPSAPEVVDNESENIISYLTLYSDLPDGSVGSLAPATVSPADTTTTYATATAAGDGIDEEGEGRDTHAATACNAGFNGPTSTVTGMNSNSDDSNSTATSPSSLTSSDCSGTSCSAAGLSTTNNSTTSNAVVGGDSSNSNSIVIISNKNENHGHDDDFDEDDGLIDNSKATTESDQTPPTTTVLPSPPGNERSGALTAPPGEDNYPHHAHHHHHHHDIDISSKVDPEPVKATPTAPAAPPSCAATDIPTGTDSTAAELSGGGTKTTQGGLVRPETTAGKRPYFDLAMALGRRNRMADRRDESPSGSRGPNAMDGSWARTRSTSERRRTDRDGSSASILPERVVVTVREDELKEPLLPSPSGESAGESARDELSTAVVLGELSEPAAASSSCGDTAEVVDSETGGVRRVYPTTTAAAAAPVVARVAADDARRAERLLQAEQVLDEMRHKTGLSAVEVETGRKGARGRASWRSRRHLQHQDVTSAGGRAGQVEVAIGELRCVHVTVDGAQLESASDRYLRERGVNTPPRGQSMNSKRTRTTVTDDEMAAKPEGRT